MNENQNTDSEIELYLTELIISIQQEKFSKDKLISRSSYSSFYRSFSDLQNFLVKSEFLNYLKVTLKKLNMICKDIINPYPLMYKEIQLFCKRELGETTIVGKKPQQTTLRHLYKQTSFSNYENQSLYGLYFLANICDPSLLRIPRMLSNTIMPPHMKTFSIQPTSNNDVVQIYAIISLMGNSMFLGSIIPIVTFFDFRIDFFMRTSNELPIAQPFYEAIQHHLKYMVDSLDAIILDIKIPDILSLIKETNSKSNKTKDKLNFNRTLVFTYKDWESDDLIKDLVKKLSEIHLKSDIEKPDDFQFISVELLIPAHCGEYEVGLYNYHKIRIQYAQNALRCKESTQQQEIWSCFGNSEKTFAHHMFECIFFDQASAEMFMTLVLYKSLTFNKTNVKHTNNNNKPALNQNSELLKMMTSNKFVPVPESDNIFGIFKFPDNSHLVEQSEDKNKRIQSEDQGNFQWKNYMSFIQDHWIQKIGTSRKFIDFFNTLNYVIQLILIDGDCLPKGVDYYILKKEIIFIFNSLAYKLWIITEMNVTLRQTIFCFNENSNCEVLLNMFRIYIQKLKEFFHDLKNSFFVTALEEKLESRLKNAFNEEFIKDLSQNTIDPKILMELKYCNSICHYLLWLLIGDFSIQCPHLQSFKDALQARLPSKSPKFEDLKKKFEIPKGITVFVSPAQSAKTKNSERNSKSPGIIEILEKNNFRNHLRAFLLDLMCDYSHKWITDPFFIFGSHLHLASVKLDIESYDFKNSTDVLFNKPLELVNVDLGLYRVKTFGVYGLKSALVLFDVKAFEKFQNIIKVFDHKLNGQNQGVFEISISTSMAGQMPYYGIIDPHVRVIKLVDDIYILGPNNSLEEASQIFAKTVIKHVLELSQASVQNKWPMYGIVLKGYDQRWSVEDINKNPDEAMIHIGKHSKLAKPICIRIFVSIDQRYIPVTKHFQFHFICLENPYYFYPNNDEETLEIFRLIFFNQESAEMYLKIHGHLNPIQNSIGQIDLFNFNKITQKEHEKYLQLRNWMKFYQVLITKSLVYEDFQMVRVASKVFHTTLGHLDYLNILNKLMQHVLFLILESKEFSVDTDNKFPTNQNKAKKISSIIPSAAIFKNLVQFYFSILLKLTENNNIIQINIRDQIFCLISETGFIDSKGQLKDVIPSSENIRKLEEIRQILKSLEDIYGYWSCKCKPLFESYSEDVSQQNKTDNSKIVVTKRDIELNGIPTINLIKNDHIGQWFTS